MNQTALIVSRFENNGLTFDVYSDGDCVIGTKNEGYIQIPADVLSRLSSKKMASKAESQEGPEVKIEVESRQTDDVAPKTKESDNDSMRRINVHKIEDKDGWECTWVGKDRPDIVQVYSSRSLARAGTPNTPVGEGGRIE
jgi:hypothetical protein